MRCETLTLVLASLACASCGGSGYAGKYTRRSQPAEFLELRGDGTLVLQTESARLAGTYAVAGESVTIRVAGGPERRGRLEGLNFVAEDGEVWARKWPAGRYAHATRAEMFVDLWPDGTFHFARGEHDHRGHYDVAKETLTLWYPSDGRCTQGDAGPAVPAPRECAFRAEVKGETLTFFRLAGEPGHETRTPGEELRLQKMPKAP
jgi:hypothetical protein